MPHGFPARKDPQMPDAPQFNQVSVPQCRAEGRDYEVILQAVYAGERCIESFFLFSIELLQPRRCRAHLLQAASPRQRSGEHSAVMWGRKCNDLPNDPGPDPAKRGAGDQSSHAVCDDVHGACATLLKEGAQLALDMRRMMFDVSERGLEINKSHRPESVILEKAGPRLPDTMVACESMNQQDGPMDRAAGRSVDGRLRDHHACGGYVEIDDLGQERAQQIEHVTG